MCIGLSARATRWRWGWQTTAILWRAPQLPAPLGAQGGMDGNGDGDGVGARGEGKRARGCFACLPHMGLFAAIGSFVLL